MTTETDLQITPDSKPPNRVGWIGRVIGSITFLGIILFLVGVIVRYDSLRRSTAREIARLENHREKLRKTREKLRKTEEQFEKSSKAFREDKRMIFEVLKQSRTAADIPDLQSNFLVAPHEGSEKLWLYVPKGSHTLEIKSSWEAKDADATDRTMRSPSECG